MKRMKITAVICAMCMLCGMFLSTGISAKAATTEITLMTDRYDINNGEEITVSIYLDSDSAIGAYRAEVVYDAYRLEYIEGGDNHNDGRVILEGTGYGSNIVYKLTFKAVSGGTAKISCAGADIRVEGTGETEKQTVSMNEELVINVAGEDTAIRTENKDYYGIESDVPLCGVVDLDEDTRYYIVDHSRYIPENVTWEYSLVEDKYEETTYTFLTNKSNEVRMLYLMDAKGNFELFAYSKEKASLYRCAQENSDGDKFYVMSANVCVNWPEDLTLDYVKQANVCYVMKDDGTCGFYIYDEGDFTEWNEEDGKAFVEGQMQVFYVILIIAGVLVALTVAVIGVGAYRKRVAEKKEQKENADNTEDEIEFIDVDEVDDVDNVDVGVSELSKFKEELLDIVKAAENTEADMADNLEKADEKIEEKKEKPVISVKDITMKFRISTSDASGIKEYFIQKIKGKVTYREFHALDHVSFDIFKGEVVGIIGTNGSGKSTLLRIISGALRPSGGKVFVSRTKLQLLTLGTGFDMELTARENIYLNGAIIGYTEEFIKENFDKIVEFAELQDFVDEKVKNFSSGMVSRLGFAIATIGEAADILILDEILSVGDEFFRKKSLKRIKEMIHGGSTVLMVSHSTATIIENCTKVVWIEKGKLRMVGEPKEVCEAYRKQER